MSNIYNNIILIISTIGVLSAVFMAWRYWNALKRIMVALFYLIPVAVLISGFIMINQEPSVRVERVKVEVPKGREELDELLKEIPRAYGVPEIVVRSIVEQESGGNPEAIRFEPSQMARASKISKNPEVQRMYASSHSFMQIMGWWSPEFGLKWTDLYDPRTNIEVGTTILKKCLERSKAKTKYQKYYDALTCYNGSEKYAQAVMSSISKKIVEENL